MPQNIVWRKYYRWVTYHWFLVPKNVSVVSSGQKPQSCLYCINSFYYDTCVKLRSKISDNKIHMGWSRVFFFTFVKKITNHRKVIWNWRTSPWNCRILNVAEKWNNFKTRVRLFGFHREQHIRLFGSEREAYIRVYWWVLCMKYIYIVVPNAQTFLWKLRRYYAIVPFFQNDSYSLWPFVFFRAKDTWVNTLHVCYVAHVITKTQQMS